MFKLAFGPKVFMVLSDPVVVKEVLKEKPFSFDKGVLAEILEPIMGQGLIPAPYKVWKERGWTTWLVCSVIATKSC